MPSRHNRNATRQSPKPDNIYQQSILAEIDKIPKLGFTTDREQEPTHDRPFALPEPAMGDDQKEQQDAVGDLKEGEVLAPAPCGRVRDTPDTSDDQDQAPVDPAPLLPNSPHLSNCGDDRTVGHTRSPILVREPTFLESVSRRVRPYVPSSIPIPAARPTPPRVSRPISFGTISSIRSSSRKRRGSDVSSVAYSEQVLGDVFGSDDDEAVGMGGARGEGRGLTTYPRSEDLGGEEIVWARWDTLDDGSNSVRLLFLVYTSGLQIWDCSNLGAVTEILNLNGPEWQRVTFVAALQSPQHKADSFHDDRPLIGIVTSTRDESTFSVYSLSRHHIIKNIDLPGLATFLSNDQFIVISTTDPPTLQILSPLSLNTLFIIPSTSLLPFSHPSKPNSSNASILVPNIEPDHPPSQSSPHPIVALSGRLLAYASPPPLPSSPKIPASLQPRTQSPTQRSPGGYTMSQLESDLGNAAIKVGGSVLSGLKTFGGMAYSAARASAGYPDKAHPAQVRPTPGTGGSPSSRFYSRSAPETTTRDHRYSASTAVGDRPRSLADHESSILPRAPNQTAPGYYVTVVDLAPLSGSGDPTLITEFLASKQRISDLKFSHNGTSLVVVPKDGHVLPVFQLRPASKAFRTTHPPRPSPDYHTSPHSTSRSIGQQALDSPLHMYDLRRGRTSAVVEGIEIAHDNRWAAVGTRKRTVHIFAINPYGGKPDHRSHLDGRVRNFVELQPLSTEVTPIVRLRVLKTATPAQASPPVAFMFISSSTDSLPDNLLPPTTASYQENPTLPPVHSDTSPDTRSPYRSRQPTNFQDVLFFDPTDGVLSLRRFTMSLHSSDHGMAISSRLPNSSTSVSLPSTSTGKLSCSPSSPGSRITSNPSKVSGLSQMMEVPTTLAAGESVIATWNLKRKQDWVDVKRSLEALTKVATSRPRKADWLAQAELTACSGSPRVLPRSIYLSHQFSFHALGEDYHALIRRYQLGLMGTKIEVRKEVSAYTTGYGESFVEGFSAPRNVRRASSSFDEPLASALAGGLDYSHSSPPVLPMLPNGPPTKSFRNPIPIRTMAAGFNDGVSEGFGRIRREVHKVRSPQLLPRSSSVSGPVPLEFDEDDEFVTRRAERVEHSISRTTSQGEGDSTLSVSTPSTGARTLDDDGLDEWNGWSPEDNQAIEDAEGFDDISAVGFLDEEQAPMIHAKKIGRR